MDEAEVVLGFLVVADEERTTLLQPGDRALDDPAPSRMLLEARLVEPLLADPADVGEVARPVAGGFAGRVVVGLVEAEVLGEPTGIGALDDDCLDRLREQLGVVDVGALDRSPERAAVLLDDDRLLRAGLGSISGIRTPL